MVLTVGSRLTDFATGSHSIFANPDVRFASLNVNVHDADRLGAVGIVADAKRGLSALVQAISTLKQAADPAWRIRVEELADAWAIERADALNPDQLFDKSTVPGDSDVVTSTDAILTQGQIIGVLQEHARPGDVIVAAAGGPPGDLQKVWDATGGRTCHLEFGFSCMGYEIPAAMGVRMAHPDPSARITAFLGDGTFLMSPTELVTAAQEGLPITLVIPENHGYQVIHRLQMFRNGREFGNEFRYRTQPLELADAAGVAKAARLSGDYLTVDLVQIAAGLGAKAMRPTTADDLRDALDDTRGYPGTVVIVVPAIPHADLPAAGVWWDVAPAEVSDVETVPPLRAEYEQDRKTQRWVRMARPGSGPLRSPLDHGDLAKAVRGGATTLGTFLGTASAVTAEVCAASGFDWLLLDLEHGAGGEEQVRDIVPAAGAYGVPTVVRVETDTRIRMGRVLDNGAAGIMLPRIDSAAQLEAALTHLRFPPRGDRGVATYNRACRFGLDPAALDRADEEILVIAQIESAAAVAAVDDIAAVDGVDVLFIGPRDLSHDLGVPGDTTAPAFVEALATVLAAGQRHGKACGLLVTDGASAAQRVAQGWTFVAIGSDSTLLAAASRSALTTARASA